jgi:S-adenosylmethionine synthetase
MKITVNKDRAAKRKQEVINEILNKAKECAEKGINSFVYHFKEGERDSFPSPIINTSVEEASEGTVKCGYRSDYWDYVKYYIG